MTPDQEKDIIAQRTSGWFAEFVTRTDEKKITSEVLNDFLMKLRDTNLAPNLFHNNKPVVLDIGTGTGYLSTQIKQSFEGMNLDGADYNGIEHDSKFAALTQRQLKGATVMPGDGLSGANIINSTLQLDTKPDILLASHSFMYSPDLGKTAESVRDLLKPDSIGFVINLAPNSDTVTLTQGFSEVMGADTNEKLVKNLDGFKIKHQDVPIRAHMNFPEVSEDMWKELSEAKPYDEKTNPHSAHNNGLVIRKMTEFVLQRPLEVLSQNDRDKFLSGLKKKLRVQNNALYLDSVLEVVTSPQADRKTARAVEIAVENTKKNISTIAI